jgi:hypothetical protein
MDGRRRQRDGPPTAGTATRASSRAVRRRVDHDRDPERDEEAPAETTSLATNTNAVTTADDVEAPGLTVMTLAPRPNEFSSSSWWMVDLQAEPAPDQGATPLVKRCMREEGWDEEKARRVLKAYRQFLQLKKIYRDYDATLLSPSLSVDLMWHQHVLDTKNYLHDCALLCGGQFVHHRPDGAAEGEERDKRRVATKEALLNNMEELGLEYAEWKELFEAEPGTPMGRSSGPAAGSNRPPVVELPNPRNRPTICISVITWSGVEHRVNTPVSGPLSSLFRVVLAKYGIPLDAVRCIYQGRLVPVDTTDTPRDHGLRDGSRIHLILTLRGC